MSISTRSRGTTGLPTAPGVAMRIINLCRQDEVQVYEVADTIMLDPALAARLLRYANSPAVGAGRKVISIREAVLLMGLRSTELLALGFSLVSPDFRPSCPGFDLNRFWAESFLVATTSRKIADQQRKTDREEAFIVGLLCRIGRLALACSHPREYQDVLDMTSEGLSLEEAELRQFGVDQVAFGHRLMTDWGFPIELIDAIMSSWNPGATQRSIGNMVAAARDMVPAMLDNPPSPPASLECCQRLCEMLNCDTEVLGVLVSEVIQDYREVVSLFELEIDNNPQLTDLVSDAREEAIRIGMAAHRDRASLAESNSALLEQASTDPLTGALNRAKFDEELARVVAGLERHGSPFAIVLLDLDHFKKINDIYGHLAGDTVLKAVVKCLKGFLRETDILARFGGEEFVILLSNADSTGACTAIERLRSGIEHAKVDFEGTKLSVTSSFGMVLSSDYAATPTAEQLLSDVDAQLYLSKQNGRNTWFFRGKSANKWSKQLRWSFLSRAMIGAFKSKD